VLGSGDADARPGEPLALADPLPVTDRIVSEPRARRARVSALLVLLVLAAIPRRAVFRALPDFFGPGDPATYFAMARGCLHAGVPRVDFVWHFLTTPPITHVEDYYEPAFAWLLALPIALAGERARVALWLPLACGLLAVALTFRFAERFGTRVAFVAGALVAIEPWSIYYSAVLMKETAVTVVVLLFLASARRLIAGEWHARRTGAVLGASVVVASLVQYELLPILFLSALVAVWRHRRDALPGFLASCTLSVLALLGVTLAMAGVPVSAKAGFFFGRNLWTPEPAATAALGLATALRFVPLGYVADRLVAVGNPVLLGLAAVGLSSRGVATPERTLLVSFVAAFLYFHGVPLDLWSRDFIPLVAVAAPFAALVLCDLDGWRARSWAPGLAFAVLLTTFATPFAWRLVRLAGGAASHGLFTIVTCVVLALGVLGYTVALLAGRSLPARLRESAVPVLLIAALVVNQWRSLPLSSIPANPQFPEYATTMEEERAACARIRAAVPAGTLMTRAPWDMGPGTGFPAVALPDPATARAIAAVQSRYAARYLLVGRAEVPDSVLRVLPIEAVLSLEHARLYQFVPRDAR
jgi:Dolichyl-phosphate-mannose-protein mannosyltransferase